MKVWLFGLALGALGCSGDAAGGDGGAGGDAANVPRPAYPESFSCDGDAELPVRTSACRLSTDVQGAVTGIELWIDLGQPPEARGEDLMLWFDGGTPGVLETVYSGTMSPAPAPDGSAVISYFCYGTSSYYTPDPCTVELLELERGELSSVGDAPDEKTVELGSRVHLRIACPEDGLYSPGADDYGPSRHPFAPHEFEAEAADCEISCSDC